MNRKTLLTLSALGLAAVAVGVSGQPPVRPVAALAKVAATAAVLSEPVTPDGPPAPVNKPEEVEAKPLSTRRVFAYVFTQPFCGPCKTMEKACRERLTKWTFDGDDAHIVFTGDAKLSRKYAIKLTPTVVYVVSGKEADRHEGTMEPDDLANRLNQLMGPSTAPAALGFRIRPSAAGSTQQPSAAKATTTSATQAAGGCASCGPMRRGIRWGRR